MKHLFLILFTFFSYTVLGQSVGLVLSGGGAKGLYHIGIIKALEEEGIPIDYVSGTSMGSIVAGLYAIGYTPDEMADLFKSDQIKYWMSGKIESRYHYYFKRMDQRATMLSLNLDLKSTKSIAVLPTNLIPSTQIDMSFNQIFGPAYAGSSGNFDNLFVPFRCIASDVYNKKEVVYRKGDIGSAVRASMTIPFVFKPLKSDSVLLYDGGIYNNFPWQVLVNDFKPDVLIGGKCVSGLKNPDQNNLIDQVESITMMHTDYNLPSDNDVMIERIFSDVGILDFSKVDCIVECGYNDTKDKMEEIKKSISRRVSSDDIHNRRLAYKASLPELVFDNYNVSGLNLAQTNYVNRMLGLDEKDDNGKKETFTFQRFKSDYFKILSEGDIVGGYPHLSYNDTTGYFSIDIGMQTKPSFKVMIGGNISSVSLNQAYLGLEYKRMGKRADSYNFDGTFSGLYTSLVLSGRTDFYLNKPYFTEVSLLYNAYNYSKNTNQNTFLKDGYNNYNDLFGSVSFGFPSGRSSVIQFRGNIGRNNYFYYENPQFTTDQSKDRTQFDFYGFQAEAARRTLNFTLYPTRGTYQSGSVIYVHGKERFYAGGSYPDANERSQSTKSWVGARFVREEYFPIAKWFSLGYLTDIVITTHSSFSNFHSTNFTSPAFTPTPHSQTLYIDKYRSNSYIGVGLMPTFEFTENFYLKNSGYLFMPEEYAEFKDLTSNKIRYIASSSLVYQTPIGPASLTVTNYDAGRSAWFVVFNFGYTLFNRKGLFY